MVHWARHPSHLQDRGQALRLANWGCDEVCRIDRGVLTQLVRDDEMPTSELVKAGVTEDSVVRINEQGDIELRRPEGWDVIGGLLGDFRNRIHQETGMQWV